MRKRLFSPSFWLILVFFLPLLSFSSLWFCSRSLSDLEFAFQFSCPLLQKLLRINVLCFNSARCGSIFYTDFYICNRIFHLVWGFEGSRLGRKPVLISIIAILLTSLLGVAFRVEKVQATGTIYIRAGGSIDPPTAPIQRNWDTYTLTNDIYDAIVVERNNLAIDGSNHVIQGAWPGYEVRSGIDARASTSSSPRATSATTGRESGLSSFSLLFLELKRAGVCR